MTLLSCFCEYPLPNLSRFRLTSAKIDGSFEFADFVFGSALSEAWNLYETDGFLRIAASIDFDWLRLLSKRETDRVRGPGPWSMLPM